MNKEEIEYMFETLTKQWGDTDNYVNDLLSYSKNLQQENQELKKQYCERTDCSGRLGNSKKVDQLEKENQRLKEIEKEHRTINGELREENKKYKEVIDKAIEYMKDFIFEPLLTNEDRKLIMYNDNLRNFEKILKEVE